jgi:phage terminase small subunit
MRERHRRFVLEYMIDLNGRAAATRAGYAPGKAGARAWELLHRADVKAMIQEEIAARDERLRVSADKIVLEYARIAFIDPSRIARWGPEGVELVPSDRLSADEKAAVRWVSVGGRKGKRAQRFLLHDKLEALEALGRFTGIFTRGPHARNALPGYAVEPSEEERQAAYQKVLRMIEARAQAIAAQRLAAMKQEEKKERGEKGEEEEIEALAAEGDGG